jgi:hypothetical protein
MGSKSSMISSDKGTAAPREMWIDDFSLLKPGNGAPDVILNLLELLGSIAAKCG